MINLNNYNTLPLDVHQHRTELINYSLGEIFGGELPKFTQSFIKKASVEAGILGISVESFINGKIVELEQAIASPQLFDINEVETEFLIALIRNCKKPSDFAQGYGDIVKYVLHFEIEAELKSQVVAHKAGTLESGRPVPSQIIKSEYKNIKTLLNADIKNGKNRIINKGIV